MLQCSHQKWGDDYGTFSFNCCPLATVEAAQTQPVAVRSNNFNCPSSLFCQSPADSSSHCDRWLIWPGGLQSVVRNRKYLRRGRRECLWDKTCDFVFERSLLSQSLATDSWSAPRSEKMAEMFGVWSEVSAFFDWAVLFCRSYCFLSQIRFYWIKILIAITML